MEGRSRMSDVFVSYARATEPQAKAIAEALRAQGYSVWRDDEIPAHKPYAEVIEERLRSSKAVLVIWSADAAKSQWVRAEADAARELGTLVQVTVDGTMPPLPFNQIQCAVLNEANGEVGGPGWVKLTGSLAVLVGGAVAAVNPARTSIRPRREKSICVLPFANMSGDAEQEYFSDGISEDITTDLSKVSSLDVIARNTAFTFKGQSVDVREVARTLGVSHVLEGSVRKAGPRVRISAQLIDGASGSHVWAERYDRDLTDIFAIQDEISKAIVGALKLKLLPKEKKAIEQRGTTSADAYNLYLMARQYWVTGNHGDVRREERVVRICQRSVELDPNYAKAWALMALAQANLHFGFAKGGDGGLNAAEKALAIDPSIAEAHCVAARHSLEQNKLDEANRQIAVALRLDPESWEVNKEAARLCMAQRDIKGARLRYEKAVSLMETDYHAWAMLLTCYEAVGDHEGVSKAAEMMVKQAEEAVAQDPSNGSAMGIGAGGLAALGQEERAREWMQRALLIDPDNLNMRYNFACILTVQLKDPEAALDLLEGNFDSASPMIVKLAEADPDFDSLRDNPRFEKLMADARKRHGMEPVEPSVSPAASAARPRS
jgi:adenylate cyclase